MDTTPILGLDTNATTGDHPTYAGANRASGTLESWASTILPLIQDGILTCNPARCVWDATHNRILRPSSGAPILGKLGNFAIYMDTSLEADGTVLAATANYLTDASLTGTLNYWVNAYVIFTSGAQAGQVRQVNSYDPATHRLGWNTALPDAPAASDTYTVTFYYVTGLANGAVNYVSAQPGPDTITRGIVQFYAALSGTLPAGNLLLLTATLDSGGSCTAHDNGPLGCNRNLWLGIGGSHLLSGSGTITGLAGDASTSVEIDHDELLNRGDLNVTTDNPNVTVTVTDHSRTTQFTVQFANTASYPVDFEYSWTRRGLLLLYPSNS